MSANVDAFQHSKPQIVTLRNKMVVIEDKRYSADYHDPEKRSIANAIQVFFNDGSGTEKGEIEYPTGHRERRKEGMSVLEEKSRQSLATRFPPSQCQTIYDLCKDAGKLTSTPVNRLMDLLVF
ncbi:hypothetical protein JL49_01465 [Pseudoalteromonas luteoviolacea]|nr:hypothetical protein JL49_01465 [Pseudoalteromonas luteoviolacea]